MKAPRHRLIITDDLVQVAGGTVRVDAHRRRQGPYSAAGALVRTIVPTLDDPELLRRHATEILTVAPSLAGVVSDEHPTLTSAAAAQERTRFYPRARTERVSHGLIDLLGAVVSRTDGTWTLVVDHVDEADATDAELLTHLLRRAHPRLHVVLTASRRELRDDLAEAVFRYCQLDVAIPTCRTSGYDDGAAYVDGDGTDPRLTAPYDAVPAARRAALHDARADELERAGIPADRLGAILWHRTRGSAPHTAGVDALLAAIEHCVLHGFYEAVIEHGRAALALLDWAQRPEDCWLVVAKLATALTALDRADEAAVLYDEACASSTLASVHLQAAYGRAMLFTRFYDDARLDHRRAKSHINTAIAISELLPEAERRDFNLTFNENGLALIEMHLGDVHRALELVTAGLARLERELGPDVQTLQRSVLRYNRALLLTRLGPDDAALAEYALLLAADPHHSEYYFERAAIHRRRGDLDAAVADYEAAIRLSPPYPEPHYNLADTLLEQGQVAAALTHLDRALDLQPTLLDAYITRAGVRHEMGDSEGAFADVAIGLSVDPRSAELRCIEGVLRMGARDLPLALAAFDDAIDLNPALVAAWANRAAARYELGDTAGAAADLSTAVALEDRPDLRLNRALVLEALGRFDEALRDYNEVATDPELAVHARNGRHRCVEALAA